MLLSQVTATGSELILGGRRRLLQEVLGVQVTAAVSGGSSPGAPGEAAIAELNARPASFLQFLQDADDGFSSVTNIVSVELDPSTLPDPVEEVTFSPSRDPSEQPSIAPIDVPKPDDVDQSTSCNLVIPIFDWIPIVSEALNTFLCFLFGPDSFLRNLF